MQLLTEKQNLVLSIIKNYISSNDQAPTLHELQELLNENKLPLKTRRSVVQYLEALEKKGYILRSTEARGIKIIVKQETDNFIDIPIMGTANAGTALCFADEQTEGFLKSSKKLLSSHNNVFALKISGDSMNQCKVDNKFIEDSDYVVIDKNTSHFNNNDIVLAIIDGCATVKKLKKTMFGEIVLIPESNNPIHKPIYIHENDNFSINGKIISVFKSAKNI